MSPVGSMKRMWERKNNIPQPPIKGEINEIRVKNDLSLGRGAIDDLYYPLTATSTLCFFDNLWAEDLLLIKDVEKSRESLQFLFLIIPSNKK